MLLDTCFLIDLQREYRAGRIGEARRFLQKHSEARFSISVISATEFLEGFERVSDGDRFLRAFTWLEVGAAVCREAAKIRRHLRLSGTLIGDFDILLAATARVSNLPLVTDNCGHFDRVSDLQLVHYKAHPRRRSSRR